MKGERRGGEVGLLCMGILFPLCWLEENFSGDEIWYTLMPDLLASWVHARVMTSWVAQ